MKQLKFTREDMLRMLEEGYTAVETSLEKFEVFKSEGYPECIGYFNVNNCAICFEACDNCLFDTYFKDYCGDIACKDGYEAVYKALEVLYLHELLEKCMEV